MDKVGQFSLILSGSLIAVNCLIREEVPSQQSSPGLVQPPSRCPSCLEVSSQSQMSLTLSNNTSDQNVKESNKLKAPAYTFGGRFKSSSDKISPSPNSYNTTGLTAKGRRPDSDLWIS